LNAKVEGWLLAAALTGAGIAILMTVNRIFANRFFGNSQEGPSVHTDVAFLMATLMLAVGAAGTAALVHSNEHKLTSAMLLPLRRVANGLVVLDFSAVLVLLLVHDIEAFKVAFLVLAIMTWVGTMALSYPILRRGLTLLRRRRHLPWPLT
jgi:uncharacterized protein YggT (Ycf19 family)